LLLSISVGIFLAAVASELLKIKMYKDGPALLFVVFGVAAWLAVICGQLFYHRARLGAFNVSDNPLLRFLFFASPAVALVLWLIYTAPAWLG
jgi:hypothetical protein